MPAPIADQETTARRNLLTFRVTTGEQQQLRQWAADRGEPLSALIRRGLQLQGFEPQR